MTTYRANGTQINKTRAATLVTSVPYPKMRRRLKFAAGDVVRQSALDGCFPAPTITGISPATGAAAGSNFPIGTTITLGGTAATRGDVSVSSRSHSRLKGGPGDRRSAGDRGQVPGARPGCSGGGSGRSWRGLVAAGLAGRSGVRAAWVGVRAAEGRGGVRAAAYAGRAAPVHREKPLANEQACLEWESEVADRAQMHHAIVAMGFRPTVRIVKERRTATVDGLAVCVDVVEHAGVFVELERTVGADQAGAVVQAELDAWARSLWVELERTSDTYDSLVRSALAPV